jgi:hypothetical protein
MVKKSREQFIVSRHKDIKAELAEKATREEEAKAKEKRKKENIMMAGRFKNILHGLDNNLISLKGNRQATVHDQLYKDYKTWHHTYKPPATLTKKQDPNGDTNNRMVYTFFDDQNQEKPKKFDPLKAEEFY